MINAILGLVKSQSNEFSPQMRKGNAISNPPN